MGFILKRMSGPMRTAWRHAPPGCWRPLCGGRIPARRLHAGPVRRLHAVDVVPAVAHGGVGGAGRLGAHPRFWWMNAVSLRIIPQAITVRPIRSCWRMSRRRKSIRWTAKSIPANQRAYEELLRQHVPAEQGMPRLDCALLGMGDDGHTASLFPGSRCWRPRRCVRAA